jgi:predicted regulator of Ras-like GTPase activity (Roadblock/LC7/MglB family)
MQEGLLVAHHLPEHLNGEAFAAFVPQIFARISHYAGEMNLGDVDELSFSARGAQCLSFRLGEVLFSTVGKTGENLPVESLRLCASQLKK